MCASRPPRSWTACRDLIGSARGRTAKAGRIRSRTGSGSTPPTGTTTPRRSSARAARSSDGAMATTQVLMEAALTRAAAAREADLEDLFEELRIPSVSTLPERRQDCLRTAAWLKARLERLGFTNQLIDAIN